MRKAGFYNTAPEFIKFGEGRFVYEIDFRAIYATILEEWLEVDARNILGKSFQNLKLV